MAGQAAACTREEVRSCIKSVEKSTANTGSKAPKMSMKTEHKQ